MTFKRMTKQPYPPRQWGLTGRPDSGKSTFAAAMRAPILVIDADGRFDEVLNLVGGDVYSLSDAPADRTDPDRIKALMEANMPAAGDVATVVVDSLTPIISPIVAQTLADKDAGRLKSLAAGWRLKALAMRLMQDAVTRWGRDVLWVWHLNDARDAKGLAITRSTLPPAELARLTRSLNLLLEVMVEGRRRGIRVTWARRGRAGMTIWDDSGRWVGMPERIEAAVYDSLTEEDQDAIEETPPEFFASPEIAWAWAHEQGVFRDVAHARQAYDKLKKERKPADARAMAALWIADVERRMEEAATNGNGGGPNGKEAQAAEAAETAEPTGEPEPADLVQVTEAAVRMDSEPAPVPIPDRDGIGMARKPAEDPGSARAEEAYLRIQSMLKTYEATQKRAGREARITDKCTPAQAQLVASLFTEAFAPDPSARRLYRQTLCWLWNVETARDLTFSQAWTCLDWLIERKDQDTGAYILSAIAAIDAAAMHRQALIDAGQLELPGVGG